MCRLAGAVVEFFGLITRPELAAADRFISFLASASEAPSFNARGQKGPAFANFYFERFTPPAAAGALSRRGEAAEGIMHYEWRDLSG